LYGEYHIDTAVPSDKVRGMGYERAWVLVYVTKGMGYKRELTVSTVL
jgi:hypothetical protein